MICAVARITVDGMARTRISTTVDSERLDRARQIVGGRDSELLDRALAELVEHDEARREAAALTEAPYDDDDELRTGPPDIDWDAELPYEGAIPDNVVELARQRRRSRS